MLNEFWISWPSLHLGENIFNLKSGELSIIAITRSLIESFRKYLLKRSYWIYPVPRRAQVFTKPKIRFTKYPLSALGIVYVGFLS